MQETIVLPDLSKILEDSFRNYFWPNFLTVVLPFIITFFVFLIIRAIFSVLLQRHYVLRQVVDGIIVLICLGFIGVFIVPWVVSAIRNVNLPNTTIENWEGYNPFVNPYSDESSYSSENSYEPSEVENQESYNPFVNPYSDESSYSSENPYEPSEVENRESYNPFVNPYSDE